MPRWCWDLNTWQSWTDLRSLCAKTKQRKGSRQTRKKTNLTTAVERIVRVRTHDAISAVTADSTAVGSSMHMKSLTASKCHDAGMNVSAKRIGFYIPATTGHVWFMVIIHNSTVAMEPGWVFTIGGCDSTAMIGQTIVVIIADQRKLWEYCEIFFRQLNDSNELVQPSTKMEGSLNWISEITIYQAIRLKRASSRLNQSPM